MDRKPNSEMEDIMEGMADDLASTREDENQRNGRTLQDFKPQIRILVPWGAGILILSVIVALFFGSGGKASTEDLAAIETNIDLLGQRLTQLEDLENKLTQLDKQGKSLQKFIARTDRSGRSQAKRLDKLTKSIDALQKKMAALAAKAKAPRTIKKKQTSALKGSYHKVNAGESLYRIAQKYGITVDELLRLNNLNKNQAIYPGQKLLVAPASK
ncbi:MAG: LysM peptidoglycan-binding domain-containing protein [Deltaproteobacteria bacterium]|nr:LysM peptidoglycan-binding domain-containing protein [Deltaproteobacteria bacterium]